MTPPNQTHLIQFLQEEIGILPAELKFALERAEPTFLPMILWQYGLVTLNQLAQIFDWIA
jgi:Protein of unknown function (DUF2949)